MGCFFACFRVKDSNPNLVKPPEPVVSKNALSSLFQCDEENQNPLPGGVDDAKELKNEATLDKARGTLPETPVVEIKKTLEKWEGKSSSLADSPSSSCITDGQNPRTDIRNINTPLDMLDNETQADTSSVLHHASAPKVRLKNKSVRFECDSESSSYSSKGSSENRSITKPISSSPYPIPLKLTDEMKTPGKITNVGSQHVHSVLNQVVGPSELTGEDDMMSTPMAEPSVKESSVGKEMKIEASLSDWLKPVSSMKGRYNEEFGREKKVYGDKTPGDRPILGMVAAHWNEDEISRNSPKWWDGNGIPNSTNKYKEDQKVSWHATPFEERLEKALSEETFVSQRKPIDRLPPFDFDETEESDTAFSHLQSSDHVKPVVSF